MGPKKRPAPSPAAPPVTRKRGRKNGESSVSDGKKGVLSEEARAEIASIVAFEMRSFMEKIRPGGVSQANRDTSGAAVSSHGGLPSHNTGPQPSSDVLTTSGAPVPVPGPESAADVLATSGAPVSVPGPDGRFPSNTAPHHSAADVLVTSGASVPGSEGICAPHTPASVKPSTWTPQNSQGTVQPRPMNLEFWPEQVYSTPSSDSSLLMGTALDQNIPLKVKEKIWNGEFIDLATLIDPDDFDSYSLSFENASSGPSLSLRPNKRVKKLSLAQWGSAFAIFKCIVLKKTPTIFNELEKYGETVKRIAAEGGDWSWYDMQFRKQKQVNPNLSWSTTHPEFFLWSFRPQRFQKPGQATFPPSRQGDSSSLFVPQGFCFKYHKWGNCSGCRFKHECFKCKVGVHPSYKCRFSSKNNSSPRVFQSQKSRTNQMSGQTANDKSRNTGKSQ